MPFAAQAQCVLEGEAVATEVRPEGTRGLVLRVQEETRVTFEPRGRARVEGVRPIAFVGRTASRSVVAFASRPIVGHGVLHVAAGARVQVVRTSPSLRVALELEGLGIAPFDVTCEDLALVALDVPPPMPDVGADLELVEARGRGLRVFAGATGGRGVRISERDSDGTLPALEVLERRGARIRVRAALHEGVTLDGWVEARSVAPGKEPLGDGGTCCLSSARRCGFGHAGETVYAGDATIRAGAGLRADDVVWGRVVEDVRATVHVVRWDDGRELVSVTSLPGVDTGGCGPVATIDRDAVVLDP